MYMAYPYLKVVIHMFGDVHVISVPESSVHVFGDVCCYRMWDVYRYVIMLVCNGWQGGVIVASALAFHALGHRFEPGLAQCHGLDRQAMIGRGSFESFAKTVHI
eukprot:sb/3478086/